MLQIVTVVVSQRGRDIHREPSRGPGAQAQARRWLVLKDNMVQ